MSSIGLIFISDVSSEALSKDFVPRPLGSLEKVVGAVERCTGRIVEDNRVELESRALRLEIEERNEPRTISVIGVWGEEEMKVIQCLCSSFGARFYDSEMSEFID